MDRPRTQGAAPEPAAGGPAAATAEGIGSVGDGPPAPRRLDPAHGQALLMAGIVMLAINLRPAITGMGPLVGRIQDAVGLSSTSAGLLTTLPLLGFGVVSILAPKAGGRFGVERVMLFGLLLLTAGVLTRSAPGVAPLFVGTAVIGAAVAFVNVLLTPLVKDAYPRRSGLVTGIYLAIMGIVAGLAAAIAIPLSNTALGWRGALAVWAAPAIAAAAVWLPLSRRRARPDPEPPRATSAIAHILRSRLAWGVTAFFGAQAFGYYVVLTWLTEILIDKGMGHVEAGLILSFAQVSGMVATLFVSPAIGRRQDHRSLVAVCAGAVVVGIVGLIVLGTWGAVAWGLLIGAGQGAGLALGLMFFITRTGSASAASELSGSAQSIGYLIAATGPVLAGAIHDQTGSWNAVLGMVVVVLVIQVLCGMEAGRPVKLDL